VSPDISQVKPVSPASIRPLLAKVEAYVGEVVYVYAFDVAYDMARQPIRGPVQ
jgi:hypothetical protein